MEQDSMPHTLDEITREAQALSEEDRARLAEVMLESLHPVNADIAAAWDREIEARVIAFDRGKSPVYPASDVFAEARRRTR
jgi:putative addiction module component (TIGR02574 family)